MERFLHYFVIVCFSCGVVALGASELHHRYKGRSSSGAGALIKELRGDMDAGRASLRRGEPASNNKIQLNEDRSARKPGEVDASKWQVSGGKHSEATDKLDSDDRHELNSMIDEILP